MHFVAQRKQSTNLRYSRAPKLPDNPCLTGLAFEIECYNRTVVTEDRLEGVRAFGEKRKPRFTGK